MAIQQKVTTVFNTWDDHAAKVGYSRLPNETNREILERLTNLSLYKEDTTKQGLVNAISNLLGYDQYNVTNKKIYFLTYKPHDSITVNVDDVLQEEVTISNYETATSGFIVWRDENNEYTEILEFINPPSYTRRSDRLHNGSNIVIEYNWRDGEEINIQTDRSNPYNSYDDVYMGAAAETVGSVVIIELHDDETLTDMNFIDINKVPSDALTSILKLVDSITPVTWGE